MVGDAEPWPRCGGAARSGELAPGGDAGLALPCARSHRFAKGCRMVMEKIERVQEYRAMITQEILDRYGGVVRVWDTPRSAIDGGQVMDRLTQPTEIVVLEEEKDIYGSLAQRAKVRYAGDKEGWVLSQMIVKSG